LLPNVTQPIVLRLSSDRNWKDKSFGQKPLCFSQGIGYKSKSIVRITSMDL